MWQRITQEPTFCLVEPNVFILDSMAFFTGNKLKYIMAILNSKLIYEYVTMIFTNMALDYQINMLKLCPFPSSPPPTRLSHRKSRCW